MTGPELDANRQYVMTKFKTLSGIRHQCTVAPPNAWDEAITAGNAQVPASREAGLEKIGYKKVNKLQTSATLGWPEKTAVYGYEHYGNSTDKWLNGWPSRIVP